MRSPKHIILLCSLFAILVLVPTQTVFHAAQNATVEGRVSSAGNAVPGATIRLLNQFTAFSQMQTTDSEGKYVFNNVPATNDEEGEYYELSVEMSGFQRATRKVTISVGEEKLVIPSITLAALQTAVALPTPTPKTVENQPSKPIEPQPTHVQPQPAKVEPSTLPSTPPQTAKKIPSGPPPKQPQKAKSVTSTAAVEVPTITPDVSTTMGGVIDSRSMRALPLADRDFLDLALLAPGTYPVEQGSILLGASLVVNGTRANMNNFLLDGADNNDYTINQSLPFQIVEAMQEFRVQASTSAAEFGRSGGGQINTISRRGFSSVHGNLFEFHRDSALSENNYFSNYSGGTFDQYAIYREKFDTSNGDPLADPNLSSIYSNRKLPLVQNQFGGNLGGPLKKDKIFGFFNWESFRVSNSRPLFERVPDQFLRSAGDCALLFLGACDPTVLKLYNLYPAPNVTSLTTDSAGFPFASPDGNFAFFTGESANRTASDNFLERIDFRNSDRASMSFKHNIQRINQIQGGTIPQTASYPGNGTEISGRNQNFSYNYVQQFSPRAGNELRLGWNRFRLNALAQDRTVSPSSIGFQNVDFVDRGLPTITSGSLGVTDAPFSAVGADLSAPSNRANNVWSAVDNFSYVRGRHNLKFGGEFGYIRLDVRNEAFGRGLLTFYNGDYAAETGSADIASIARVSPALGGGFDRDFRTQSYDWFVQDQWRVRPNFSLNYGIRYEVNTAPVEARNRLVNYYPNILGPGQNGLVRSGDKTVYDPFGNQMGTVSKPVPRAGFNTDNNDWGPRLGFAWDPWNSGKTVIRGGYALMYDQQPLEPSVNMLLNPPFVMQDFTINTGPGDIFGMCNGNTGTFYGPGTLVGAPVACPNTNWFRLPYSITARDPNTRTAYVHQVNFGIQRQVGSKGVFEIAYAGSAGHRLPRLRNVSNCTINVLGTTPVDCIDALTGTRTNTDLFPTIVSQENSATSNFHSLLLRFETRSFHGLQMQAHYQFAKSIDDASSLLPQVFLLSAPVASLISSFFTISPQELSAANSVSPALSLRPGLPIITTSPHLPQDSSNLRGERALSDFDIRHRFVLNFIYDVPKWESLRALGSGWELAGILTVQSGQPFSVFADYFGNPIRPNLLAPVAINDSKPDGAINNGVVVPFVGSSRATGLGLNFDPSTFVVLPGNLGRNTFSGPGLRNMDFSIIKNTYLGAGERKNFQIRAEFFNLSNATNFYQPYSRSGVASGDPLFGSTVLFDPLFGRILQARPAFAAQFAAKFSF
jgi:hypothetical protein